MRGRCDRRLFQLTGDCQPAGREGGEGVVLLDHVGLREVVAGHLDALDEEGRRLPALDGDLVVDVGGLVLLHLGHVQLETRVEGLRRRERDVGDAEVDVLHQALVRVERRLVVAAEPQLRHLQPVLLDRPGHVDVALHVHAADDHVGARLLHALHVGRHGGARVADLQVGVADVVAGGLQGGLLRLARGRRRRDPVGDERDGRLLLRLPRHIGVLRRAGRVVLDGAAGGEEVGRSGPVAGHVVAVGRHPRLHEQVGREERRRHAGHGEHVVLVDEGVGQLVERRGVAAVVERVLVVDLAAVHAALGVDVLVVGLLAVDQRGEVRRQRPRLGRDGPHRDGVRGHPWCRARRLRRGPAGRCRDDAGHQCRPGERRRHQRPESLSHSHAVPNHPSRCIPPGMPVTVAVGRSRPLLHHLCSLSLPGSAFPSPSSSFSAPLSVRKPRFASRHAKNSLWRSNSRNARTSSGRTADRTSTSRATSGSYPHDDDEGAHPLLRPSRPRRGPPRGAARRRRAAGCPCR